MDMYSFLFMSFEKDGSKNYRFKLQFIAPHSSSLTAFIHESGTYTF